MAEEAIPVVDGLEDMSDLVDEVVPEETEAEPTPKAEDKPTPKAEDKPDSSPDDDGIPDDLGLEDPGDGDEDPDVPTDEDIAGYKDLSKAQEACKSMRTQIVALKKEGGNGEAAKALQARVDELEAAQAGTDLSQTPAYQETYVAPIKTLGASIQTVAEEKDVDGTLLRKALLATESKERLNLLKSATDDHDTILELIPMMQEMDKLRGDAATAISEAQKNYKESMDAKATAEAEARSALVESTLSELGKVHFLLRDSAKKPEWMKGIREAASSIIDGSAKPEAVVEAALKAQVSDHYLAMFSKTHKALLAAQNEIDTLRGVRPRNDAKGGGDKDKGGAKDLSKVMDLDALVDA